MIDAAVAAYLLLPVVAVLAAVLYGVTRAPDRIQLATLVVFAYAVAYFAVAYDLTRRPHPLPLVGLGLGAYALVLYVANGALAIWFKEWAWGVCASALIAHLIAALVAPFLLSLAPVELAASLGSAVVSVVGLWAVFQTQTRALLTLGARPHR